MKSKSSECLSSRVEMGPEKEVGSVKKYLTSHGEVRRGKRKQDIPHVLCITSKTVQKTAP